MQRRDDFPTPPSADYNAALILADGSIFFGRGAGAEGSTIGEICFNTAMTGYQEIMTDPSYAGQIINFTFPHIGNVGVNSQDMESGSIHARGAIFRASITSPSNYRSEQHFDSWLKAHNIPAICGIDTRALTNKIRKEGPQNAMIVHVPSAKKFDWETSIATLQNYPSMKGRELAKSVTSEQAQIWGEGLWHYSDVGGKFTVIDPDSTRYHIVAVDYGIKQNILRYLAEAGNKVTLVPAYTPAAEILALEPDGVFLSNGPGDPAATAEYALPVIKALLEKRIPIFGICLGHQLLAAALGCQTEKMHRGHRGANHPIKELSSGKVLITSQNHGFVVSDNNLPEDLEITHISLFDGTVQGIRSKTRPAFSMQGHPEASPGPHDIAIVFDQFMEMMKEHSVRKAA